MRLEKVQRDFLWGGGNLEKKFHLVNWNTICSSKEGGGLGTRDLSLVNKALLASGFGGLLKKRAPIGKMSST